MYCETGFDVWPGPVGAGLTDEKGDTSETVAGSLDSLARHLGTSPYLFTTCTSDARLPRLAALLPVGSLAQS
jgi:hypothetical protein